MKPSPIQATAADLAADRIRARRRVAVRVGLLVIAMTSATACIFDRSTYQGGGRIDHGATAATQSATDTVPQPDAAAPAEDAATDTGLGID